MAKFDFMHSDNCPAERMVYFDLIDEKQVSAGRIYACLTCRAVNGRVDLIRAIDVPRMIEDAVTNLRKPRLVVINPK